MTTIRLIGIGSPNGDDAVGWWLTDALNASRQPADSNIEIVKLDRPGASLLKHLVGACAIIIVDALVEDELESSSGAATVGEILPLSMNELEQLSRPMSSHEIGVADSLRLARALDQLPKSISVLGVRVSKAMVTASRWRSGPSPALEASMDAMIAKLECVIERLSTAYVPEREVPRCE